jgi:poly(A) polymerase Pap1
MAYALRSTNNIWDLIKLKNFQKANDTVNRTKWKPTDWKKIFTKHISNRELTYKKYKELKKINSRETNNPFVKWSTQLNRKFSTEEF